MTDAQIDQLIAVERGEVGDHEEDGPNTGTCAKYQKVTGNDDGASWCMSFQAWGVLQVLGHVPFPRDGRCQIVREWAYSHGYITDEPTKGCLGFVIDPAANHAHHVFLCADDPSVSIPTIEGNTNTNGSSNGTGVYERHRAVAQDTNTYEYFDLRKVA